MHFLDVTRRDGLEVANHFKWLANVFPVTFLFVGVGLRARGLLDEGLTGADAAYSQTARRWNVLTLEPFEIRTRAGQRTWRQLLLGIERELVLSGARRGMVADDLPGYLFTRSTGHFASLMSLISRGCYRAIRTGTESLTSALLDAVRIDQAAEDARGPAPGGHGSRPAARPPASRRPGRSGVTSRLPFTLTPLDGEPFEMWLHAYAARLALPPAHLAEALGIPRRSHGQVIAQASPAQLAAICTATGLAPSAVTGMFTAAGPALSPQLLRAWTPQRTTRFCPACLATGPGQMPAAWRLLVTFFCIRHGKLLAASCPHCGRKPAAPRKPSAVSLPVPATRAAQRPAAARRPAGSPTSRSSPFTSPPPATPARATVHPGHARCQHAHDSVHAAHL